MRTGDGNRRRSGRPYLAHKDPYCFFRGLTVRVRSEVRAGPALTGCVGPRGWRSSLGIGRGGRVGVHEEHEFNVAASEEAVYVVVLERIYTLEVALVIN